MQRQRWSKYNVKDKRATILVVDDTPDVLLLMVRVLSSRGYRVVSASNGQEALEQMQQAHPDLVLLDLSMPMLNGWDTLSAIRQFAQSASLPVIAVTAHAMSGDREAVLLHGFNGYITKPLDMRLFLDTISATLQSAMQQRP
jgi:two-component system, cell cycle response regulator DivK